ncbi:MAG TPA: penicillin-binding protein 2 [Rubrobacteraceae bacterium]|nr:penicillin-binding protein 2 [Rubrobacteraceae bacterium]
MRFPANRRARWSFRATSTGAATREVGRRRMRLVVAAFLVTALLLGGRAVQMSVADGDGYLAHAAEPAAGETPIAPEDRGSIISADGRQLATSLGAARVVATPYLVQEPAKAAEALSRVISPKTAQSEAEIEEALTKRNPDGALGGYSVVASGLDLETAEEVEELGIEGVSLSTDAERVYPEGALASQLLGYVGGYDEAFGGVEARYDEQLESGEDVTLTVDSAVQLELEEALAATVEKNDARSALGLVMRADDGAIVALANSPGYDNAEFTEASAEAQRDRVLTDPYEPGSTFKAFTVAAALDAGAVTPESSFTVPDQIQVADRVIHDSQPHETKVMAPADILRESSNVGAIQVAQALGGSKVEGYIRRFGFGEATGVDLWGEDPGLVPAYEDWSGSSIGNIPIGQGITVTPLQLVAGYATLANGGRAVTPHVTRLEEPAALGPRVISGATSDIVRGMLQGVVDDGSGHNAQIPGYTVAGKTGTSQVVDPNTGTYGGGYVASFVGFAPASDPEYVALVAVDDPGTTYWGEVVAAPAFEDVMSFTLGYFNVPPDRAKNTPSRGTAG